MPKGRHRRQQVTQLPPGARAGTGKSRTAAKQATYGQPLPIRVEQPPSRAHRITEPGWFSSLLGWVTGRKSTSLTSERPHSVTAQWDPITKAASLTVTRDIEGQEPSSNEHDAAKSQTDAVRLLWECGFFGKGTLSRSEPTWRARQVGALRVKRQRALGTKIFTPEELTALRRKERKAAKIERAKLAVRAGQQLADGITALGGELTKEEEEAIARDVQHELDEGSNASGAKESSYGKHIPGLIYLKPTQEDAPQPTHDAHAPKEDSTHNEDYIDVQDMETLQLSGYETLFLAGMLGILDIVDEKGQLLSLEHIYALLLSSCLPHAHLPVASPLSTPALDDLQRCSMLWSRPDNPFLLNYVAYHHFRSLGWVVRSGIKFCVDLLLYKKGPAFSHAEFAVVVLPVYEDPEDAHSSPFGPHPQADHRDWVWFSSVNRVNTQVLKTLVLCYVIIPPQSRITSDDLNTPQSFVKSLEEGRSYRVREYSIRRFTPQRMRA